MQTERVTFLTTPQGKAAIAARAAAQGVSIGEYIRRKVEDDEGLTPEQEEELALLVEQVNEAIPKMNESIDSMIETLRKTRQGIRETLDQMSTR